MSRGLNSLSPNGANVGAGKAVQSFYQNEAFAPRPYWPPEHNGWWEEHAWAWNPKQQHTSLWRRHVEKVDEFLSEAFVGGYESAYFLESHGFELRYKEHMPKGLGIWTTPEWIRGFRVAHREIVIRVPRHYRAQRRQQRRILAQKREAEAKHEAEVRKIIEQAHNDRDRADAERGARQEKWRADEARRQEERLREAQEHAEWLRRKQAHGLAMRSQLLQAPQGQDLQWTRVWDRPAGIPVVQPVRDTMGVTRWIIIDPANSNIPPTHLTQQQP